MNNWQYIADQTFINKLMLIDWQAIFLRLISSNEGKKLTLSQAIVAIEQYGLLLYLISKYPHKKMVPNEEIDVILHAHIANTEQFEQDCINLFDTKLTHVPEVGVRAEERQEWLLAFAQTHLLFKRNFGQDAMSSSIPACCELLLSFG
ncbi:hypothetical protein NIES4071_16530 [Calothrix sp. NIES-4071]|nr:hypothetical protein NIES4071_16530 [Calothrix sp. NIES-4071]BAZ55987.1 hypothetical protein NIES4105_16480 [Calothrix sp. NIES-4105]